MIKSMTGYGSAKTTADSMEISIELKSVNNRYLDTSVRLPRSFMFAEEIVKAEVQKIATRGKVDVFISIDSSKAQNMIITVNEPLAEGYVSAIRAIADKFGLENNISATTIARMPDVLNTERREVDREEFTEALRGVLGEALAEFDGMRANEGAKLVRDIESRLGEIERLTGIIEERSPKTVDEYRRRLEERIRDVLEDRNIDESRLITEAAIFADRVAVSEETVRLRSHLSQLGGILSAGSPAGRKLDFLVQELNREANTIGSKCNDTELSMVVVDLKAEIEKIREQVQNIE